MKKLLLLGIFCLLTSFAPQKQLSWMAIGDSITFLDGHQAEANNRITNGYMEKVTEKLPYIHYVNHGHSGWTAARLARQIVPEDLPKADIYSVFFRY